MEEPSVRSLHRSGCIDENHDDHSQFLLIILLSLPPDSKFGFRPQRAHDRAPVTRDDTVAVPLQHQRKRETSISPVEPEPDGGVQREAVQKACEEPQTRITHEILVPVALVVEALSNRGLSLFLDFLRFFLICPKNFPRFYFLRIFLEFSQNFSTPEAVQKNSERRGKRILLTQDLGIFLISATQDGHCSNCQEEMYHNNLMPCYVIRLII